MAILAAGIDLAKNESAVHGVGEAGAVQLRQPEVARAKLDALIAALPPYTIGIEACSARTTGRAGSRPAATRCA